MTGGFQLPAADSARLAPPGGSSLSTTARDVAYRDVRRFGTWLLLEPGELDALSRCARIGGEPLDAAFTTAALGARARRPPRADQGRAPRPARRRGRREHLRRRGALARAHPSAPAGRRASTATRSRAARKAVRQALELGIARQGSTLSTTATRTAGAARCSTSSASTGASGEPCHRCGTRDREDARRRSRHLVLPRLPDLKAPGVP